MAHVEPDGLPVDTLAPALCDALTDVSTELVDGLHAAHGRLTNVGWYGQRLLLTVSVDLDHEAARDDALRVERDLGGYDAPVLVRGLTTGRRA